MNTNPTPTPSMQSVTEAGRVLQAPGGRMFSSLPPLQAGALRGAVWGIVSLLVTELVLILQSNADLHNQWKPALAYVLAQSLRIIEAAIDQQSVKSP